MQLCLRLSLNRCELHGCTLINTPIALMVISYLKSNTRWLICCLVISTISQSVFAEQDEALGPTSTSTDNSVYPASFFDQYRPQNALEMVERLPGFNFDQGSNARGFGGNAGNVLIDGARPTSKSGGIRTSLVRIPATQVERIEILRGGVGAGEAAGQSIVANVIRKSEGTTGSWAFKERWTPHVTVRPNLEAAIATHLGDWATSFDIDIGARASHRTADIEVTDQIGDLESGADEELRDVAKFAFINAEGSTNAAGGKLTLNARIGGDRLSQVIQRDIFGNRLPDGNAPDQFWDLDILTKFRTAELGVDWIYSLDDWKWHVIGLTLANSQEFKNNFHFENPTSAELFDSAFVQDSNSSENIARITYGRTAGSNFKPELGIEVARNELTSDSQLFLNNIEHSLNGGDVTVEELRLEVFTTFVYDLSKQVIVEGGLTAEFSEIKVTGDSNQQQNFSFIKPRLSVTYKINPSNQIIFEIDKQVGQLDFDDFAASSQADDDRTTSGNPDLAPNSTNEISFTYDWSFSERGSLKIKTFYQDRIDILEQVLLPSGGQGIGNAGDAEFWGVQTDLNLPLDLFLPNGLLELTYFFNESSFDDPITNRTRTVNSYTPRWLTFKIRQDLVEQKFAWGIEYFGDFTDTNFFVDERQTFSGNMRFLGFVETSQYFGTKIQLEISNINTAHFNRTRFIFQDNRGKEFVRTELAKRIRQPEVKLTISKNF
jgi:hypothetical protein